MNDYRRYMIITGAYGLVGTNLCKELEKYDRINVYRVKFDESIWRLPKADYIIHAAGYGQPAKFSKEKLKTIYANTDILHSLFKRLKPGGKFLYISTSEIYSGAKPPYKETDIGTTSPLHPRACYIEGKRCGEAICLAYREQGFDVKIARLGLGYGPGTKKGDTRALHSFIEQAITTGKIVLMDKGESIRTYCYIDDVIQMLLHILFDGKDIVYNVGGTSRITIAELALLIGKLTGAKVIFGEKGLEGAPEDVSLDLSKWGDRQFIQLEEGLKKTIKWQKSL